MCMAYERLENLKIDLSPVGIERSGSFASYYCTPKNAQIIGSAGVDGIHYCTIPEFGEMIFAVSPMNFGDCVHPIARNFEDLLRLLLYCVDMAALEQCYAWDEAQFQAFLTDCPATKKQKKVLDTIQRKFGLEPMADAFSYVRKLQAEVDLSEIPYTEDYYDPEMNPAAPVRPAEWRVTYDGGFWHSEGEAGREIPVGRSFCWGSERWYVPAVYICGKGLVVDYFMEADPAEVNAFIEKWDLYHEDLHHFTKEQQEQISREQPLNVSFHGHILFNGRELQSDHGCGLVWVPDSCQCGRPDHAPEARQALEHYGLDAARAWSIHRSAYRWGAMREVELQSLAVRMEREPEGFAGQHIVAPAAGESLLLRHPLREQTYLLTVHALEEQELPADAFQDPSSEYPTHFLAMSYSLEPDIDGQTFMLQDCSDGDRPRKKRPDPNEFAPAAFAGAVAIGVIGGADGPTAILFGKNAPKLHTACSSLHFEPVGEVEWRTVFSEKTMDDITVQLAP